MDYDEFITCLMTGLQDIYGKDVVITTEKILKNNGQYYHGLRITMKTTGNIIPIIYMDEIYEEYKNGSMGMEECAREVCRIREENECPEDIRKFAGRLMEWEFVKDKIYPILLSAEDNRELLQKLVSTPFLDLSIAYIIRGDKRKCVKINRAMLDSYGIDRRELHGKAMENMKKDGYRFRDMEDLLKDMIRESGLSEDVFSLSGEVQHGKMYVLTNSVKMYGAAGILDKKLIREFAAGRNFFILPSAIHETIFVPTDGTFSSRELDKMVSEINETQVEKEERLTDYCYYYDAGEDEIRICE